MNKMYDPSVPEGERIALMMSDLYRPALHITSKMQIQVSSFKASIGRSILDFTAEGCRVLRVVHGEKQDTYVSVPSSVHSFHNLESVIETNKPMYMAKALTNTRTKAWDKLVDRINDAKGSMLSFIEGHVRIGYNSLVNQRKMHMSYRDSLNNTAIAALVQVFFNERNAIDVRPDIREALETVRSERDRRDKNRNEVDELMRRMFEPRKWFITYMPTHGYTVRQIDIAHSWDNIQKEAVHNVGEKPGIVEVVSMQFFRSLEDMPEQMKQEILPSLTYAKLHMQGRHPELKFDAEPNDLVPYIENGNVSSIMSADTGVSYLTYHETRSVMIDAG